MGGPYGPGTSYDPGDTVLRIPSEVNIIIKKPKEMMNKVSFLLFSSRSVELRRLTSFPHPLQHPRVNKKLRHQDHIHSPDHHIVKEFPL